LLSVQKLSPHDLLELFPHPAYSAPIDLVGVLEHLVLLGHLGLLEHLAVLEERVGLGSPQSLELLEMVSVLLRLPCFPPISPLSSGTVQRL